MVNTKQFLYESKLFKVYHKFKGTKKIQKLELFTPTLLLHLTKNNEVFMKATSSTPMSNLIGCIFKHLRNEQFADQELVALRLGLSVSTISKIELGNVGITVESIFRLCELFGIDMIDFFKYLNDAKEYLESRGVQVYVDRSLEVKGVDKRVVSYEIEKNIKV